MTDFIYWLGDFFYMLFKSLEMIENNMNWFLIFVAFALFGWWMKLQKKYNEAAASNSKQLK